MNICIIGYGSIGKRHHQVLKDIVGSKSKFTIIDVDTKLKIEDVCDNIFDILVICTPTSNHLEAASKFSNIKKIIFIEKPLGTSIENIEAFRDRIDIDKVHVGCNLRFTRPIKEIRKISKIARLITVTSMSHLPSWRPGTNHLESYSANNWLGGGVTLDFIHEPDYISAIFGLPEKSKVTERRLFDGITNDSNDSAFITWEYSDKLVNFSLSYASKEFKRFIDVIDEHCESTRIEITRQDIEESYKNQWTHIIKNGPVNTYDHACSLQKLLQK